MVELGVIADDNHKILPEFHFSFGAGDRVGSRQQMTCLEKTGKGKRR